MSAFLFASGRTSEQRSRLNEMVTSVAEPQTNPVSRFFVPLPEAVAARLRRMSPTVLRVNGYRLYFFSREELRLHVHAEHSSGEAKIWLEPSVEIAHSHGLHARQLEQLTRLVQEHQDAIRHAWEVHFGR